MLALLDDDPDTNELILLEMEADPLDEKAELAHSKQQGKFNFTDKSNDWTVKNCRSV